MAELTQCDKCKTVSPDEQGLHVANKWVKVHYLDRKNRTRLGICDSDWTKLIFCRLCFKELKI